ncbi:MAG: TraR/DksA C4-type zinc finger protein [Rubrivivax sp.]|nr:TraR/DksA C4-type zinc finger protein [Rubrivivax sp.]
MDERWTREFREIRSLLGTLEDERRRAAFAPHAAGASDEALLALLADIDDPLIQQNLQDVRDIAGARRRIGDGSYGLCLACGDDIAYERLLAYPTAKRCIECQRAHERRKAAPGAAPGN